MCLVIKTVPQNDRIVKCYKVFRMRFGAKPVTPFMWQPIPTDGILLPGKTSERKSFEPETVIDGRFIHAYIKRKKADYCISCFLSYAFRVEAYGSNGLGRPTTDLICRGLYIPGLDKTRSYGKILEVKRMLDGDPSTEDLIKEFPRLRRIGRFL